MKWEMQFNVLRTTALPALLAAALAAGCGGGGTDVVPTPANTGTLGATVSGLKAGNTVELDVRGSTAVSVAANSSLNLASGLALNSPYLVTVKAQPAGQVCSVANGLGKATAGTATVEVTCVNGVPTTPAELGATVSGAPPATQYLVAGQVSYGHLQIAAAPGVDASKLRIEVQQGVIAKLVPVAAGQYLYEVDAAKLAAGSYPYSLKVVDATSGAYTLVKGEIAIQAPTAQGQFSVGAAGGSFALSDGTKFEVAANGLAAPVGMSVAAAASPIGPLLAFTFDREVSAAKVKIRIERDSTAVDPYHGLPTAQASTLARAKAFAATLFERAKAAVGLGSSGTATLNPAPYAAASTLPADTQPMVKQGLGNLVQQGKLVPFILNSAGLRNRLWDELTIDAGFTPPDNWVSFIQQAKASMLVVFMPAYEVHSSIVGQPADLDWSYHEPVLFVHGFAPSVGGGAGTWAGFPKLAMQTVLANQKKPAPFEYHWRTNQSFRQSADDLANAIQSIHNWSNKPVHIVAHSFGGVLARTVLQKISRSRSDVDAAVASLTTLGSPYSGIFDENAVVAGVQVPKGQDALTFELCRQLTCFEMGEPVFWSDTDKENFGLLGDYATAGAHTLKLARTAATLPNVPIHVGIGLTVQDSAEGLRAQTGDYLISFAGQRFELGTTRSSVERALLNRELVGQAKVTESILGMPYTLRPGELLEAEMPSARAKGYLHSSVTGAGNTGAAAFFGDALASAAEYLGVFNLVDLQNAQDAEWVLGRGLMAAPSYECATPATCVHAGYLLFKQALADPLNRSNVQLLAARSSPAVPLKPGSATWPAPAERVQQLRELLREASALGIVNGNGLDWRLLPASERERFLQKLEFVPAPAGWKGDYGAQYEALSSFRLKYSRSANLKATIEATIWSADAAGKYVQLAGNMVTALRGELALVYPHAAVAAEVGTRLVDASKNADRALHILKQLKVSAPFLNVFKDCAVGLASDFTSAIDKLEAGDKAVANWANAVAIPVKCLAAGFELGNESKKANFASLFATALNTVEGTEVAMLTGTVDAFNTVLGMLPPDPYLMRVRGGLDIVSAVLDSIAIGNEMAANAQATYNLDAARIDAQLTKMVDLVNEQRTLQLLTAKSITAYSLDDSLAGLQLSTTAPNAGSAFTAWLKDVWVGVKSAVISFSDQLGTAITSVLPDGTTAAISKVFSSAGPASVFATLFDGVGGTGIQVGRKQLDLTVAPGLAAPIVNAVVPVGSVTGGVAATFEVQGSRLVSGLAFALNECQNITELQGQGTATLQRFTCTFPTGTAAGVKTGAIALAKDAGNPFGAPLLSFQVTVAAAPVAPRITSAIEFTPANPVVGDTLTFIARGEGLLNSGWVFKFNGMDYCGAPKATPTTVTATELRYACTATAPTNLQGVVAVTSPDMISQHGSALLVSVACPAGKVLNTQTGQCDADAGAGLATGLVGHWSFDSCDAKDSSVNANHGAFSGAPVCVAGQSGKALRFNGSTDSIVVPSTASFPKQAITLSYWLHREGHAVTSNLQNYLSKELAFQSYVMPSTALTAGLWLGTPGFWTQYGGTASNLPTLADWVHFTFTYDNATRTAKNYLNGVLVETTVDANANALVRQSPYPLYIGRNGSANVYWIKGLLDEVRIYDRVLSATEVLGLKQFGNGSVAASSLLPPTGAHSAQCFMAGGASMQSCLGADALALSGPGKQDGMILRSFNYSEVPRAGGGNYARSECVQDGHTGLMWEGKTNDGGARAGSNGTFTDMGDGRSTDTAAYAAYVNSIALCGFSDWRLPQVAELQSIVHYGMGSGRAAIDPAWFPNSQGAYGTHYRSTTLYRIPYVDRDKFVVSLWDGGGSWAFNLTPHHVRLVRGGNTLAAGSRFVEKAGGSEILDNATGLTWSRCAVGQTWAGNACVGSASVFSHEAALAHVKAVSGWRIPNVKELTSIVNFGFAQPSIDITVFPQTPSQTHWTATAKVDGGDAWAVSFYGALFGSSARFYEFPIRLVREQ